MAKLLATDLDGTLLYPKRRLALIYRPNKVFLRKFVNDGNRLVLVSGRGIKFCHKIAKSLKIDCDFVSFNGSCMVIAGEIIEDKCHFIDKDKIKAISQFVEANSNKTIQLLAPSDEQLVAKVWQFGILDRLAVLGLRVNYGRYYEKVDYHKNSFEKLLNENSKIFKYSIMFRYKNTSEQSLIYDYIYQNFSKELEIQNLRHSIEITPININKATALEFIANKYEIEKNDIYVIGDDVNDIPMFKHFPNSFAMKRALELVKWEANKTIDVVADMQKYIGGK